MPLAAGTRLGVYDVIELLGAGGMGEVYRAHDSRLKRDVAVKTLRAIDASDHDRAARFGREAEILAALNHPNIAHVYGVEDAEGSLAIVMELVDGSTLAELVDRGPVPIAEALAIARQIADGLEAAHDHGVIHRDLKPANIKIKGDGTVKILDFGLAKSLDPVAVSASVALSPTITSPAMTRAGVILGTASYMSPEQARGKPVDRRADVWAFGCVLFEMLAGRRPIAAEDTVSDTIAAVLKSEPAWTLLPPDTPPKVRALLERCLRKDLRRRLPHIAEARIEIEEVLDNPVETTPTAPASFRRSYFWPAVAALSLLLGAAATSWSLLTPGPAAPGVTRFDVTPPEGAILLASLGQTGVGRSMEIGDPISPDGHTLAFLANVKGKLMIWLRPLESPAAQPLPRTEDASRPIWSPDSRYIAFFAQGQVKKIAVAGGPPITICTDAGRDLAWSAEDMMLIGGYNRPLYLVSASGGEPIPVTELGPGETTHDYPQFLPDNRHYLFLSRRGGNPEDWDVFVGSLDSKERRRLDGIHAAVRYSPTGHLLFIQDEKLMAQRFDAERLALVGEATPVVDWISAGPRTLFSIAANGTLAYLTPTPDLESQLAWVDRSGAHVTPFSPRGVYNRIDLSPDGRQVAFDRQLDLLLFDIERNLASTFLARPGADVAPVFSPDGGRLAFTSNRTSNVSANNPAGGDLYERTLGAVDGDRPLSTKAMGSGLLPTDWSRDGYLAYTARNDVWALPPPQSGRTEPLQVTKTLFNESGGAFSPDGRWIAYQSNDSLAGLDIYVQAFPDGGRRYPVSAGGGTVPRWSRDGKEIYYIGPEMTLMAAAITSAGTELAVGTPVRLFQSPAFVGNRAYDVGRDGRFLINLPSDDRNDTTLAVIVNWAARLKQ